MHGKHNIKYILSLFRKPEGNILLEKLRFKQSIIFNCILNAVYEDWVHVVEK
jgi:hypothetical protein